MLKVFILSAQMSGGFAMLPIDTEINCLIALAALPPSVITEAECYEIEMIQHGSVYAPEMAPLAPRKPGQKI